MQGETGQILQRVLIGCSTNSIPKPARCLTGGRGQSDALSWMTCPRPLKQVHHRAGLAGAGATAEQHHSHLVQG